MSLFCGSVAPAWGAEPGGQVPSSLRGKDAGDVVDNGILLDATARANTTIHANATSADATAPVLDFDIPAQPLAAALSLYAFVTHQPVLYPSDLAAGRTSSVLRGRYSPEAALARLLSGTGLSAESRHTDAGDVFVLADADADAGAGTRSGKPRIDLAALLQDRPGYSGLVQSRIWQAICADPDTVPGHYATLLRFQVDTDGSIRAASLVDSTGDAHRDAALLNTVEHVRIGWPPPPELARQPWTMAILPNGSASGPMCRPGQTVQGNTGQVIQGKTAQTVQDSRSAGRD